MSFFGQNNNNQPNPGFGGFGSNNTNTTGGFGQPATSGAGFGSGTTGTSGGFSAFGAGGTPAFGSNNNTSSLFAQNKPAFGASTSSGGLFGSGTATAANSGGFGGFGSNNTNTASSGGLFGSAPKPAFGSASTSSGLFGNANTGGFGSTNNQSANTFGSSTALSQNNTVCEGTGSTPFTAYTEKEGTSAMTNHFQSISFMAPYKNFSFEELRIADYNQGRRYGNGSGQAGAFGSTNFGGFGQSNNTAGGFGQPTSTSGGGLFGSTTATSAPFGNNQNSGFGASNSGSSLFGQKPGGLFGAASSSGTTGGLFGTSNNTTGGFGSGGAGGGFGTGSGGLFGQNNNQQQQSKPFSFGSTTATTGGGFGSGGTGFGSTNSNTNTGGGLFGSGTQANSSPFGQQNNAQTNTQTSNPFGGFGQPNQTQNQSTTSNPFGGFGQQNTQEQKPGGLFGNASSSTNTSGGLFGTQNNTQTSSGLFGQSNNNQSTGNSLFGAKPATGGGLFGQTNSTNANPSGGLFGGFGANNANQNQTQQNQGGGLFANNTNNNQQKPGGLFGSTTSSTGGGLFGNNTNNNNQQSGGSLFNLGGANNQTQQQPAGGTLFGNSASNTAGSSLFGNSQQQQQQPAPQNQFQPAQTLQTSIGDPNAFGSPSIFSGLPPPPQVSGPIATPISQKSKQKKNALMPYYKLTPTTTSRLQTPQKRGFGFSYATYGTPGSASSNASTPGGLSSSLLHSSLGRTLGKSLSTSNLRGSYGDTDSILTPGAFSAGSSRYGGAGSMKKLTIDRNLRTDLFGDRGISAMSPSPEKERQPGILKKKVSFDASTLGGNGEQQDNTQSNNTNDSESSSSATPSAEEQGFLRSPRNQARMKPNGTPSQPEMEQVRGNELAIVPEDEPTEATSVLPKRSNLPRSQADQKAGEYWMDPSKESLQKLSKEQRRHVSGLSVGREGCGKVVFNNPVDISNISLTDIYENIIVIGLRSLTVYPDQARKPAMGKGLNVPSTIYLENSWPRQRDKRSPLHERSGSRFNKHVERLRRVTGTEFVNYEKDTGTWIFSVPHFTTYGFDYDDDASEGESLHLSNSTMTEPPDTPTPKARGPSNGPTPTVSAQTQRADGSTNGYSQLRSEINNTLGLRGPKALPGSFKEAGMSDDDQYDQEMEEVIDDEESFLDERLATSPSDSGEDEPSDMQDANGEGEVQSLIIREEDDGVDLEMAGAFPEQDADEVTAPVLKNSSKETFNICGDWASELQRTIRPRKQDRRALRNQQSQGSYDGLTATPDTKGDTPTLSTHADIGRSLFGEPGQAQPKKVRGVGMVTRKSTIKSSPSTSKNLADPGHAMPETDRAWGEISSSMKDKCVTRLSQTSNLIPETLLHQRAHTAFAVKNHVPMAVSQQTPFEDVSQLVQPDSTFEKSIWTLASILFDGQNCEAYGVPKSQKHKYDARIRKDRLIAFWRGICEEEAEAVANEALCEEERAVAYLSANKVVEACESLVQGGNYRLATLVAQIGGTETLHDEIAAQISSWRDLNVLSEMSEPIRTLYSLLAGDTCICEGKQAQHIEDKARTFPLSDRFKLDWKRAFGLRLYYAIKTEEPIEVAVSVFAKDLENSEPAKPGDDMLYTLLQLFAGSKKLLPLPSLGQILIPPKSSPSPLTPRLSFQLYQALTNHFPSSSDSATADTLARLFAVQLDTAGEWLLAMFSLLHVSEAAEREENIKALLAHRAKEINVDPPVNETWSMLVQEYKIPEAWIWQAKAMHARAAAGDRVRETNYLIKANEWSQAHDVFKGVVGPECVIGEEWAQLQGLLKAFSPVKDKINGWALGGQVYADYLALVMDQTEGGGKTTLLKRLSESLPMLMHSLQGGKRKSLRTQGEVDEMVLFKETVALQEISRVVSREVLALREKSVEAAKKLRLPTNKDAYLEDTIEMSQRYYKSVTRAG